MRPFQVPWTGNVLGVQCFYGFLSLEEQQGAHTATFGAWLPDDAEYAVRERLDTVKFIKSAQVSFHLAKLSTFQPCLCQ